MIFAKKFARNYEEKLYFEHQTLGRRVICPSKPAYYMVDCRISDVAAGRAGRRVWYIA